jgi:hypothetical protein
MQPRRNCFLYHIHQENVLSGEILVVMMEAAVGVGTKTAMPRVEAVVKNIYTKEVREGRRVANPRVGLAEAASAHIGCKYLLITNYET